jgi:hypothetical protein
MKPIHLEAIPYPNYLWKIGLLLDHATDVIENQVPACQSAAKAPDADLNSTLQT